MIPKLTGSQQCRDMPFSHDADVAVSVTLFLPLVADVLIV